MCVAHHLLHLQEPLHGHAVVRPGGGPPESRYGVPGSKDVGANDIEMGGELKHTSAPLPVWP